MTREEYMQFAQGCCDRMMVTTKKKNNDYSGGDPDPFYNFTRVEAVGFATTEQGFLTRMFDKFSRISTFVKKGVLQVSDETVEDTLLDLANYCILFAGYIRHKKQLAQDAQILIPPGKPLTGLTNLNEARAP